MNATFPNPVCIINTFKSPRVNYCTEVMSYQLLHLVNEAIVPSHKASDTTYDRQLHRCGLIVGDGVLPYGTTAFSLFEIRHAPAHGRKQRGQTRPVRTVRGCDRLPP